MPKKGNSDRSRALMLALIVTLCALVVAKLLFALVWYGAFLFAIVVFGLSFALVLRAQRNTFQ